MSGSLLIKECKRLVEIMNSSSNLDLKVIVKTSDYVYFEEDELAHIGCIADSCIDSKSKIYVIESDRVLNEFLDKNSPQLIQISLDRH